MLVVIWHMVLEMQGQRPKLVACNGRLHVSSVQDKRQRIHMVCVSVFSFLLILKLLKINNGEFILIIYLILIIFQRSHVSTLELNEALILLNLLHYVLISTPKALKHSNHVQSTAK